MAKLFYSLEEAAQRLNKSPDEVKAMVERGELQEFRDRDRLMFKVDQIELLAGGTDDDHPSSGLGGSGLGGSGLSGSGLGGSSFIPLAGSGEMEAISLASDSGSGMNLESPKEQTGISIFDTDSTEVADPSAVTQVTETSTSEIALETVGSGSGLLDLTREADDTSLGQDLLEEVSQTEVVQETVAESPGALFESTGAESDVGAAPVGVGAGAMALAEPYDGTWSGISGGVALGMVAVLALVLTLVVFGLTGATGTPLVGMIADNFWAFVGGAAGVMLVAAVLGMVFGKRA